MATSYELWCYDIEIYRNYAYFRFIHYKTREIRWFRVYGEGCKYDRNDIIALKQFVMDMSKYLAGYNSYEFDDQILNYVCKTKTIGTFPVKRLTETLKHISDNIINNGYNAHKYDRYFKKIDVKRVAALQKSAKYCAMNLRMDRIQELPIKPHHLIMPTDIEFMEYYCDIDVNIVVNMVTALRMELRARWNIELQYGIPALNESNSSISNALFTKMFSDMAKVPPRMFEDLRSPIDSIKWGDVIFDNVEFKDPVLIKFVDSIRDVSVDCLADKITSDLPVLKYKKMEYQLGVGGLHSVDKGARYKSTVTVKLKDGDVNSYYPYLIVHYKLYPEHLGEIIIELIRFILENRIKFKMSGDEVNSYLFKIVLNALFGKFGSKHSYLYSPKRMLQTTVNGQLFLLMWIEDLETNGIEVISANTDGVTVLLPEDKKDLYFEICKRWEANTGMTLDYTDYIDYIRLNVNNYYASYMKGGKLVTKRKGKILNKHLYEDLTKSYHMPIIAAAIENYYVNGEAVSKFIRNHNDPMDFYVGATVGKEYEVLLIDNNGKTEPTQNTLRYYISNSGYKLLKTKPRSTGSISAGNYIRMALIHDKEKPISEYDINYNYYIGEAQKWIRQIETEFKRHNSTFRDNVVQGTLF